MSEEQSLASYIASTTGVSGQYLQPPGGLPLRSEKAICEWFGGLNVPEEHQEEYNAIAKKVLLRDRQALFTVIAKAIEINKAAKEEQQPTQRIDMHPWEFIARALKKHGFEARKDGGWNKITDNIQTVVDEERVISALEMEVEEHNRPPTSLKYMRLNKDGVLTYFREMKYARGESEERHIAEQIRHPSVDGEKYFAKTQEWLTRLHVLLKIKQPLNIWLAVMSHYMWAVKRRIIKSTEKTIVKYPIWVSLFGNQGIGKDYVTERVLFGILEGRYSMCSLAILEDFSREKEKFRKNFVINFNELVSNSDQREEGVESLTKGAIAQIKMLLTADKLDIRLLKSHTQSLLIRRCEFFSTANFHLYDLIRDPSGMRRFFEFESLQPKLVQFDSEEVEALSGDIAIFAWIGIDENRTDGYFIPSSDVGKEIVAIQDSYRGTTSIHQWIEHDSLEFTNNYSMDVSTSYNSYKRWCAKAGIQRVYALPNFKKMLDLCGAIDPTTGLCNIDKKEGAL